MEHLFIGERMKYVRTNIFKQNQRDFAALLNEHMKKKRGKVDQKELFSQNTISNMEIDGSIRLTKLIFMLNYLFEIKQVNPSWLTLEYNNSQPLYLKRMPAHKKLFEIHQEIKKHQLKIDQNVNDIRIILDNSGFE